MSLRKFSWREFSSRPLRAFLTFLSITIGVGAVVAVLLATSTTRKAQRDMLKAVSGKADLEIISGGVGFPLSVLKDVSGLPGIDAAVPDLNRYGTLFTSEDRKARTQVLGIDPRIDQLVRDYTLVEGEQPSTVRHAMLDKSFADSLGIVVGDSVKLLSKSGLQAFTVVGLVRPSGGTSVVLGSNMYLVLPAAQRVFQTGNKIDQIHIVLHDRGQEAQAIEAIAQKLPEGVTVRSVRSTSDFAQEALFAPQNGLLITVAYAVLIATFIIYNAFQMAVGERRKQLGILRAVGATPKQIRWMILREALWISAPAAIVGCAIGVYGAGFLNGMTETILQIDLPGVHLQWWPFVVAIAIGLGVSLLGALIPASSAAAVDPMEAIRATEPHNTGSGIFFTWKMCVLAWFVGLYLLWLSSRDVGIGLDFVGIIIILLGCVLVIPRALKPVCLWLADMFEPILGVPARLATKQLLRHVGRTSMTVSVLFVALAMCMGMAGNVLDHVRNVHVWFKQTMVGDFFVRSSLPNFTTGSAADLPATIEQQVSQLEGVQCVITMRYLNVLVGEDSLMMVVRDFSKAQGDFFDWTEGSSDQAIEQLKAGKIVVGSVLANRRKLKVGDTLPISAGLHVVDFTIAGISNDYLGGGLTVHIDRPVAHDLLGIDGVDGLIVQAIPDQRQSVEAALKQLCKTNGLILQSYAQVVGMIDGMVNSVVGSLWMLLALGCAIAAMGLVNTLTMNILEQTREIGMLRVIAMTRSQVRRMIFAQALFLGLLALIPGAIVGTFVQFAIGIAADVVLGHNVSFLFRPELFLGAIAVGLALVLIASLVPAERAARLDLATAMHYE